MLNKHLRHALAAVALFIFTANAHATSLDLRPSASLSAIDVVEFQLKALQTPDNDGIAATFRFASPANKSITGPLDRFAKLFEAPQYNPMLRHSGAKVQELHNNGMQAELVAGIVDRGGQLRWYKFVLSKQSEAPYVNCWMTDAVSITKHPGKSA